MLVNSQPLYQLSYGGNSFLRLIRFFVRLFKGNEGKNMDDRQAGTAGQWYTKHALRDGNCRSGFFHRVHEVDDIVQVLV